MEGTMADEQMKVSAPMSFEEVFLDPVFVSEEWALPGEIPVHAELETGERVDIQVEVTREGARASRVCVETDSPKGVGSVMLRRVPVRNAMATGCYLHLLRVNRQPDGTVGLMPDDVKEEDVPIVTRMIERLIGYERLRREEGRS
jgi:hypothetical protein